MIDFPYTIVRSPRRKTIGITVSPDNTVTVRIPQRVDERFARKILEDKADWVRLKLAQNLNRKEMHRPKEYRDGEEFLYLGEKYLLEKITGRKGVNLRDGRLCVGVPSGLNGNGRKTVAAHIHGWYRDQALDYLAERVLFFRDRLKVYPKTMRLKKLKSRWGSCSSRGNLNFNWLIIMAPPAVVDYVVVHELCHCLQQNHSPRFWALVESILPDYRDRRTWLRVNSGLFVV
ncbi:MAG: M48 family metallopeptidase [Candidatus Latescibacterota bacterium]